MKKFYLLVAMTAVVFSMQAQVSGKENGHEYVDLGLSVKWATCNIGATSPEKYGDYFAWGETTPKKDYSWNTYKYAKGNYDKLTKYCNVRNSGYNGYTDNKTILDSTDDAAHINWGGKWRLPSFEEIKELENMCTWKWITQGGVNGYKVTGPSGNSIFLPAAGFRLGKKLYNDGNIGHCWSNTLYSDLDDIWGISSDSGWYIGFGSIKYGCNNITRHNGFTIRPVCK